MGCVQASRSRPVSAPCHEARICVLESVFHLARPTQNRLSYADHARIAGDLAIQIILEQPPDRLISTIDLHHNRHRDRGATALALLTMHRNRGSRLIRRHLAGKGERPLDLLRLASGNALP